MAGIKKTTRGELEFGPRRSSLFGRRCVYFYFYFYFYFRMGNSTDACFFVYSKGFTFEGVDDRVDVDVNESSLLLELYDHDLVGADDALAQLVLPLSQLPKARDGDRASGKFIFIIVRAIGLSNSCFVCLLQRPWSTSGASTPRSAKSRAS